MAFHVSICTSDPFLNIMVAPDQIVKQPMTNGIEYILYNSFGNGSHFSFILYEV